MSPRYLRRSETILALSSSQATRFAQALCAAGDGIPKGEPQSPLVEGCKGSRSPLACLQGPKEVCPRAPHFGHGPWSGLSGARRPLTNGFVCPRARALRARGLREMKSPWSGCPWAEAATLRGPASRR